jgi:hypothetical protein
MCTSTATSASPPPRALAFRVLPVCSWSTFAVSYAKSKEYAKSRQDFPAGFLLKMRGEKSVSPKKSLFSAMLQEKRMLSCSPVS